MTTSRILNTPTAQNLNTISQPKTSSKPLPLFQDIEALAQNFEDEKTQELFKNHAKETQSSPLTPVKRTFSWLSSLSEESPTKKPKKHVLSTVGAVPVAGDLSVTDSQPAIFTPPLAPTKNNQKGARTAHAVNIHLQRQSPYEQLFSKLEKAQGLNILGLTVALNFFAAGSFMNSYSVKADLTLIPDVPNDHLLLKAYHGIHFQGRTKFTPALSEYMQNSIDNYNAVQRLRIPVATIYNLKTALEDRFFIVKKIPHAIDLSRPDHIEQVSALFKKSFQNRVLIDLAFSNLRADDNGTVTLVDFVEQPFDFNDKQKMKNFAIKFLNSWRTPVQILCLTKNLSKSETKEKAQNLLMSLTQDLDKYGFNPTWIQGALDESFIDVERSSEKG